LTVGEHTSIVVAIPRLPPNIAWFFLTLQQGVP
jgi:hypothetical protein